MPGWCELPKSENGKFRSLLEAAHAETTLSSAQSKSALERG